MQISKSSRLTSYLEWSVEGHNALWRYALAIALAFLGWFILPLPFVIFAAPLLQGTLWMDKVTLLFPFFMGFVSILLAVKMLLGRPWWSVAMPCWPCNPMPYFAGIGLALVLSLASLLALYPFVTIHFQGFDALLSVGTFSFVVTLVGLVIQTGFEELLFRGLIMQCLVRTISWVPAAILLQALLFGAMHLTNIAAWHGNLWGMLSYVLAGISFGYAAWRTGSLLIPAALHFVNNVSAVYIIGSQDDVIQTVAPWLVVAPTITQSIIAGFIGLVFTVLVVELYMHRLKPNKIDDTSDGREG